MICSHFQQVLHANSWLYVTLVKTKSSWAEAKCPWSNQRIACTHVHGSHFESNDTRVCFNTQLFRNSHQLFAKLSISNNYKRCHRWYVAHLLATQYLLRFPTKQCNKLEPLRFHVKIRYKRSFHASNVKDCPKRHVEALIHSKQYEYSDVCFLCPEEIWKVAKKKCNLWICT